MLAGSDLPHVPDHRALGIEIGGCHQQHPTLAVFLGDPVEQLAIDVPGDQLCQPTGVGERLRAEQTRQHLRCCQVIGRVFGPDLPQPAIVFGPEVGERSGERTGADAGDHFELRAVALPRPAHEQAGGEGAITRAAGNGQILDQRAATLACEFGCHHLGVGHVRLGEGQDVGWHLVAPEAGVGQTRDGGFRHQRGRHRCARRLRRAAHQQNRRGAGQEGHPVLGNATHGPLGRPTAGPPVTGGKGAGSRQLGAQ